MTHEDKINEWKCEAERCIHEGWEEEIFRLRAALTGCIKALRVSSKQHDKNGQWASAKYCEGCAKIGQETLEGK